MKRIFLIVLDSVGAGEAPDAAAFGDVGAHTLRSISASPRFSAKNLRALGLGNIDGLGFLGTVGEPRGAHGRLRELSLGKDTTIGHWEIGGIVSERPLPTYPEGFPKALLDEFSRRTGRGVICNLPYSGTEVIADYGEEHLRTGNLIVYTSADSVFQIAAHEDLVPPEELYRYCRIARELLVGEHGVGRVIARPFIGEAGHFTRTANRHDFSIEPPRDTLLDALKAAGREVIGIGKIGDIFVGRGLTESHYTHSNTEGMEMLSKMAKRDFTGLCFANLVDFDMLYGHRRDVDGYAAALAAFDGWLGDFLPTLGEEDAVIVTADHGCDPAFLASTDHTREYVPLLVAGKGIAPVDLGTIDGFATVGATVAEALGVPFRGDGQSILSTLLRG